MTDTLLYDVMGGMDKLNNISVLDFPNNTLTDECIDVFTKAMANKKITLLNLSNNKISNEGVKNLAIFIANGKSYLVTLNLSLNLIEDDGAVTLLKVWVGGSGIPAAFLLLLPFCPSELILKRGLGVPAIIKIEHKHHCNLQCKCCHCLNCSPQAISLDKLITEVNLSSNRLGLESSGAVRDLLKLNRLIESLDLSCNQLTLEGGVNILEGLKYNTSIKYLDVRSLIYCILIWILIF